MTLDKELENIRINTTTGVGGKSQHHGLDQALERLQEMDPTIRGLKEVSAPYGAYHFEGTQGYVSDWQPYR